MKTVLIFMFLFLLGDYTPTQIRKVDDPLIDLVEETEQLRINVMEWKEKTK